MNKKTIILGIVIIIVIALGGGLAIYYKNVSETGGAMEEIEATNETEAISETEATGAINENGAAPQIEVKAVPDSENSGGSLTVCLDKCGDGICQKTVSVCEGGNLNCVCVETQADCPQDCK